MLIGLLDVGEEPDRFPPATFAAAPEPLRARDVRSRWPVDDTTAIFLLPGTTGGRTVPVEVDSWSAFSSHLDIAESDPWGAHAVYGYFLNGGRRAVVIRYGDWPDGAALDAADAVDGVATVVAPSLHGDGAGRHPGRVLGVQRALVERAGNRGDRLVLIDPPPQLDDEAVRNWRETTGIDSWCAACYHPWIRVMGDSGTVKVPPSGHVAGLLAYSDLRYGAQKPPANEPLGGVIGVPPARTQAGDILNPIGVNLIRRRPGAGIVVWGARSMAMDGKRRLLDDCRSLQLVARLVRAGASWVDDTTESSDDIWRQLHVDLTGLVVLLRRCGLLEVSRPEATACVRRVAERSALVEVALPGSPAHAVVLAY